MKPQDSILLSVDTDMTDIQPILKSVLAGKRLSVEDCTVLLESHDIASIGAAAD